MALQEVIPTGWGTHDTQSDETESTSAHGASLSAAAEEYTSEVQDGYPKNQLSHQKNPRCVVGVVYICGLCFAILADLFVEIHPIGRAFVSRGLTPELYWDVHGT